MNKCTKCGKELPFNVKHTLCPDCYKDNPEEDNYSEEDNETLDFLKDIFGFDK